MLIIIVAAFVAACGSSGSPVDVDAGGTYYADAGVADAPDCTLAPPAQHTCSLQYASSTAYVCAATSSPPGLECMYLAGEQALPDGSPWIVCCFSSGSGSL